MFVSARFYTPLNITSQNHRKAAQHRPVGLYYGNYTWQKHRKVQIHLPHTPPAPQPESTRWTEVTLAASTSYLVGRFTTLMSCYCAFCLNLPVLLFYKVLTAEIWQWGNTILKTSRGVLAWYQPLFVLTQANVSSLISMPLMQDYFSSTNGRLWTHQLRFVNTVLLPSLDKTGGIKTNCCFSFLVSHRLANSSLVCGAKSG